MMTWPDVSPFSLPFPQHGPLCHSLNTRSRCLTAALKHETRSAPDENSEELFKGRAEGKKSSPISRFYLALSRGLLQQRICPHKRTFHTGTILAQNMRCERLCSLLLCAQMWNYKHGETTDVLLTLKGSLVQTLRANLVIWFAVDQISPQGNVVYC